MKFTYRPAVLISNPSSQPVSIVEQEILGKSSGSIVSWIASVFAASLTESSPDGYAHCLLHFVRRWEGSVHTADVIEAALI